MTPELTVLALAGILQFGQIGLAGAALTRDTGPAWNAGPRDREPELSPLTGRLRRAVNNHFEGLALFTIAVLVTVVSGQSSSFTAACAWAYLAARVLYVPAYAYGWTPWRSVIWAVGALATVAMLVASLV